ncbi:MAG: hypothetical protein Q9166_003543 [cf. Caloplaca sp. 2 TL-2023]
MVSMAQQQPSVGDAERAARLRHIQMEALGTSRRDFLTTYDAPDRFLGLLTNNNVDLHRRVNQRGTRENIDTEKHKANVDGWNSAWTQLQHDEALEEGLEDINAGQSHRARLILAAPQQPEARPSKFNNAHHHPEGGSGPRGTGRGGRGSVKLLQAPIKTEALATNSGTRIRTYPGNFTLAAPGQFMSHVLTSVHSQTSTDKETTEGQVPSPSLKMQPSKSSRGPPDPQQSNTPQPMQPLTPPSRTTHQSKVPILDVPGRAREAPPTAMLLDAEAFRNDNDSQAALRPTYADDLLGMDIDKTANLPAPMKLSTSKDHQPTPTLTQASLEQFSLQFASFLPVLRSILPAEVAANLESVSEDLQKQIGHPSDVTAPRSDKPRQNPIIPEPKAEREPQKEAGLPARGIANAVQQRTMAWGKEVIAGTDPNRTPILGENISRWRFNRRPASMDSLASAASAGSSTALTEGVGQLRLGESKASVVSQAPDGGESRSQDVTKYASINPFGSEHHRAYSTDPNFRSRVPAAVQLPDFLRSEVRSEDPAAALRAEYNANTSRRVYPTGITVPQVFPPTPESSATLSQKPLHERVHGRSTVEENRCYPPATLSPRLNFTAVPNLPLLFFAHLMLSPIGSQSGQYQD